MSETIHSDLYGSPPPREGGTGLAIASVILGLLSIPALCLCGLGIVMALVSIVLGVIHMARGVRAGRVAAGTGMVASLVTLGLAGTLMWISATMGSQNASFAEWRGREAPPLQATTSDGIPFSLAEHRGEKIVVALAPENEFGTGIAQGLMQSLRDRKPAEFDVEQVIVGNPDLVLSIQLANKNAASFGIIPRDGLPDPYGQVPEQWPVMLLIDEAGMILEVGYNFATLATLLGVIETGKPIER